MRSAPVAVSGLSSTVALALGGRHSCALSASGAVSCWGDNASGQLGLGDIPNQPTPTSVSGLSSVAQLGAGTDFTCALATDGRVRCFGDNARGQIGTGSTGAGVNTPTLVSGLDDAVSLSLGDAHVCAARAGGAVSCWGAGGGGQLGDGDVMDRSAPGDTDPLIDQAVSVAVGADHSCARLGRGAILCWGLNRSGQVGDGSTMPRPNPTLTVGLP
jgi:alpha-tubulin suppressor-like RCC1 family protein